MDPETWKKVDVVYIDIADRTQVEPKVNVTLRPMYKQQLVILIHLLPYPCRSYWFLLVFPQDYKPEEDPCKYKSMKTGRGPLGPDWRV